MTLTFEKAERTAHEWCDASTRRGKAELRVYCTRGMTNSALHFEFEDVRIGVSAVAVPYRRESGMRVSDAMELDEEGPAIPMIACDAGGESDV